MSQKKNYRKIIYKLRKEFQMEVSKDVKFDLREYSIIEKGKLLKNNYTWKLLEFDFDAYLLNIRNSYKVEGSSTYYTKVEYDQESRHNAVIMKTDFELPEFIIRPANIGEKIANIFLNFDIKLSDRKKFNKKYILESSSTKKELNEIISSNLTNELNKHNEFSLEFKKRFILLKFEKEFNIEDSINMINIGKLIETEIKTLHNNV